MDAGALGRHDLEQPAVLVIAQLQMADGQQPVERRAVGEAAHPLESDPGLILRGGTQRDTGTRDVSRREGRSWRRAWS